MLKANQIYNMDCLEGMKQIDDRTVDLIICDLPYGLTDNNWDTIIPLDKLWVQYERIIKDNGVVLFTAKQPFTTNVINSNPKFFKYEWIWRKEKGTGFVNANKMPLSIHESILVFYKKQPIYNAQKRRGPRRVDRYRYGSNCTTNYSGICKDKIYSQINNGDDYEPVTILEFPRIGARIHPNQKPVALFEYLIKTYTNEGQLVLDPCMGSGTTAIACQNIQRQYIGFETDVNYYNIIQNRIHANCMKLDSFEENKLSIEG